MNSRLHCIISGSVQGVSFRWYAQKEALRLGLTGWVWNRLNGTVECVAEGKREALEQFLAWCRRGPAWAQVIDVHEIWEPWTGEFDWFDIRFYHKR